MATHSSVLAWRIPGTGKPGGLPSMGSHRVGHDWHDLAAAARKYLKSLCHSAPSPYPNTKRFYCIYLISTFSPPTAWFFFFFPFLRRDWNQKWPLDYSTLILPKVLPGPKNVWNTNTRFENSVYFSEPCRSSSLLTLWSPVCFIASSCLSTPSIIPNTLKCLYLQGAIQGSRNM